MFQAGSDARTFHMSQMENTMEKMSKVIVDTFVIDKFKSILP
jgi:hypothetical protein